MKVKSHKVASSFSKEAFLIRNDVGVSIRAFHFAKESHEKQATPNIVNLRWQMVWRLLYDHNKFHYRKKFYEKLKKKFVLTNKTHILIFFFSPFSPFCCYCKIFAFSLGFCTQISRKYQKNNQKTKHENFLIFFKCFSNPCKFLSDFSRSFFSPFRWTRWFIFRLCTWIWIQQFTWIAFREFKKSAEHGK